MIVKGHNSELIQREMKSIRCSVVHLLTAPCVVVLESRQHIKRWSGHFHVA